MVLDKQFIFIMGSSRSGTTWLQMMIAAHPLVCTTVELTPYQYTAPWIRMWERESANIERRGIEKGLPFLWTEDEFYDFLRDFLRKVYERVVATNPQATHILDKNPEYCMYVEDIDRLLPNARFVHMIRDGRDVAVSMVAARQQMGFGTGTVPDSAAAWKSSVRAAQKARLFDDRYLEVRYEDLSTDGADTLKSVFDFCGLRASMEDVAEIVSTHQFEKMRAGKVTPAKGVTAPDGHYRKGKVGSWQEHLDPMQRYLFDEIAGDLLCELGYAEDGWWAESASQKIALPLLAAISNPKQVRRKVTHALAARLGPTPTGYLRSVRSNIKKKLRASNISFR